MNDKIVEMTDAARRIRGTLVKMSYRAGTPHLGSALSSVDILVAAYWGCLAVNAGNVNSPDRDRLILSKGHAAAALYAVLAERGILPLELLDTFAQPGSRLAEQMGPGCAPGIEAATGSLGHGLSLGLGMALAAGIQGRSYRVCVVLSDGECNEGTVWEAAMLAAAQRAGNLTAVIDFNGWQATGRTDEIMALSPLAQKWEAFGWNTAEVDGHDVAALQVALNKSTDQHKQGRPRVVIAHTIKGKGVSFMEGDNNWHYRIPDASELHAALAELSQA